MTGNPLTADGTGSAAGFGSLTRVAVDSVGNVYAADNETVRKAPPPYNDLFLNRTAFSSPPVTLTGTNAGATKEPGEPNHAGDAGGHSLWWSLMALTNDIVNISTVGSTFNSLLAVYTGSSASNLSLVASNHISAGALEAWSVSRLCQALLTRSPWTVMLERLELSC